MKQYFLIILILLQINSLYAINIDNNKVKLTDFKIEYLINNDEKINFEDLMNAKFEKGKNKDSLGTDITNVWLKIKLTNNTNSMIKLFIHQNLAFTFNDIVFYEANIKNELIKKTPIYTGYSKEKPELLGANSVYSLNLEKNETKIIYINQKTLAYHFYDYSILTENESIKYLIYEKADGIFFFGLLVALALYNLLIFLSTRYKEYLYYFLYLLSATIWVLYMYGSLSHYFSIYGELAVKFNFALMLTPIFLALFIQSVFETKEKYKTEHLFLNSIIVLLLSNIIYALIDFNHALAFLSLSLNYSLVIFLLISISIYKKGNQFIKIFLTAHIFYIIFSIYGLIFYMGIVDFNYISSRSMGIGIIIEALILSYLISYKFKKFEQEKNLEQLLKQNALNDKSKIELLLEEKNKLLEITEQKSVELIKLNKKLEELSITDKLTKLYNRTKIDSFLEEQLKYSKRYNEPFSVILLDIDFFKKINDTHGHQTGDIILSEFSSILKSNIRETDVLGRWGGEEFIIICPKTNLKETLVVAKKIKSKIENYNFTIIENCTASFGVSSYKDKLDIKDIIKNTDEALYKAKNNGRNQICIN